MKSSPSPRSGREKARNGSLDGRAFAVKGFCMLRALLPLALLSAASLSAQHIETAFTRYYKAEEIRSVGDYFGARSPRQGFRTLARTDAEAAAGQYFILRLEGDFSRTAEVIEMQVLRSDTKEIETVRLALQTPLESRWLYFGLTGKDWPGAAVQPVAWSIEIKSRDNQTLAAWKSFLWEKP